IGTRRPPSRRPAHPPHRLLRRTLIGLQRRLPLVAGLSMRGSPSALSKRGFPCALSEGFPCALSRQGSACVLSRREFPCALSRRGFPCALVSENLAPPRGGGLG